MIKKYFFGTTFDKIEEEGYIPVGESGLMVAGASIDFIPSFHKDLEKTIIEANLDLKEVPEFAAVFYKTKSSYGKSMNAKITQIGDKPIVQNDAHFYIVQGLVKK